MTDTRRQQQMTDGEVQGPPELLRTVHVQLGCQMDGDYWGHLDLVHRWRRMTQQVESRHVGVGAKKVMLVMDDVMKCC